MKQRFVDENAPLLEQKAQIMALKQSGGVTEVKVDGDLPHN
jgi:hypothetical protein